MSRLAGALRYFAIAVIAVTCLLSLNAVADDQLARVRIE